jgi:hypothetical protein
VTRPFQDALAKYGAARLLEMLRHFQCKGEAAVDDDGEETYGTCKRLGIIFMPNAEDGEVADFENVSPECVPCYENHAESAMDGLYDENCWTGKDAAKYFNMSSLKDVLQKKRHPHLEPSPFGRGKGGAMLYAANQVTWGAQLVVDQNVWALYWSLIQKHVLDK